MKFHYRTLFISDTHLGSRDARAAELARFLKIVRCEKLYLVGDIIDMERLRHRWHWPAAHNDVVRRVLKMVKKGCQVVYLPGNHDEAARQYTNMEFGGVRVLPHVVHRTADGRELLVIHGDLFDLVVKHSPLLCCLGNFAYDWLVIVNRLYNLARRLVGRPYWSLSQYLKLKVKSACTFISRFETALIHEARKRKLAGVVCGHIHKPDIRTLDGGLEYFNCGDWVESCTALVEHFDGRIELIDGLALIAQSELNHEDTKIGHEEHEEEAGTGSAENPEHEPGELMLLH